MFRVRRDLLPVAPAEITRRQRTVVEFDILGKPSSTSPSVVIMVLGFPDNGVFTPVQLFSKKRIEMAEIIKPEFFIVSPQPAIYGTD
jgi:hypothetical protein